VTVTFVSPAPQGESHAPDDPAKVPFEHGFGYRRIRTRDFRLQSTRRPHSNIRIGKSIDQLAARGLPCASSNANYRAQGSVAVVPSARQPSAAT